MYNSVAVPTDIFGLKYRPHIIGTLAPNHHINPDDIDQSQPVWDIRREHDPVDDYEFSFCNRETLKEQFNLVRDTAKLILEIGVHRAGINDTRTSTYALLTEKRSETIYIGVDTEDRSFLCNIGPNIHTLQCGSQEHGKILAKIIELGVDPLFDFIFIDGWHSVNQCMEDWKYVQFLRIGGIVGMHDTNGHPGPVLLFDAIDESKFEKQKYCVNGQDFGIAFARRVG